MALRTSKFCPALVSCQAPMVSVCAHPQLVPLRQRWGFKFLTADIPEAPDRHSLSLSVRSPPQGPTLIAPIGKHIGLWVPLCLPCCPSLTFNPSYSAQPEVPGIKGSVDKDVPGETQCPPPSVKGCWSWDGAWWAESMTTESRERFFRMVAFMGFPCLPAVSILSSNPPPPAPRSPA